VPTALKGSHGPEGPPIDDDTGKPAPDVAF